MAIIFTCKTEHGDLGALEQVWEWQGGLHVCPMLEEELHHSRVATTSCRHHRPLISSMHVCAVPEEELHHLRRSVQVDPRCCRRAAQCLIVASVEVCAVPEEELHSLRMAVLRCLTQRLIVESVHVCAVFEKDLHNGGEAKGRCLPQRIIVAGMHVCAVLEEQLHHSSMAFHSCHSQRTVVTSTHICAMLDEHNVRMATLRRLLQCQMVTSAHMCTVLDEQLHHSSVAILRGNPQRLVVGSVYVTAGGKKLRCLDVPVACRAHQGLVKGLPQRVAVLVHASSHHGADHSDVAKHSRTLQAREVLALLDAVS